MSAAARIAALHRELAEAYDDFASELGQAGKPKPKRKRRRATPMPPPTTTPSDEALAATREALRRQGAA